MSKKKLLITRPNHDVTTNYLCEWSNSVVHLAAEKNFDVHDLKGSKATEKNVTSHLQKNVYVFLILNGHGSSKQIAGHKNEILIEVDKNHKLLKNKIVYSISCSSAKELGKVCVADGVKTFIGYEEEFVLIYDKNMYTRPLKDEYAKSFLRPANLIPQNIIKGKTVIDSIKSAEDAFRQEIIKMQSSESVIGSENVVMALIWNLSVLKVHGDTTQSL